MTAQVRFQTYFGAGVLLFLLPAVAEVEVADDGVCTGGASGTAATISTTSGMSVSAPLLPPSWRLKLFSWFYQLDHSDPNLNSWTAEYSS